MKNWTIKKRIIVGFATVLALVTSLAITSFFMFRQIRAESDFLDNDALPGMEAMTEINNTVGDIQIKVLRTILAKTGEERKKFEDEIAARRAEIQKQMEDYDKTITQAEDREMFKILEASRDKYIAARARLFEILNGDKPEEAAAFNVSTLRPAFVAYQEIVDKMLKYNLDNANKSSARSRVVTRRANLVTASLSVVVIFLGIAFATTIVIGLNRALSRVATMLGDGSAQIVSAASQVSSSAQSLAEGASEQAASLEETSASIEELSSITKRNAENAKKANDLARQARGAADTGAADMQAMNQAMEAIKVSSDDIAKIIKTIDEIAFQTNILALNAAVEAARAGEAGMGFAVVADEVRNLAQRCAQSAKETSAKIEGAITRTTQGVELSAKVTQGLQEIVAQVRKVDELAAEVAGASSEQSTGISQVSVAVGQMDKVTQSNAANAEESASAAEEMNSQAEMLNEAVGDLLRLVGGTQKGTAAQAARKPASHPSARTHSTTAANGEHHPALAARNGHGAPKRQTSLEPVKLATASRKADAIPMDGDFQNF